MARGIDGLDALKLNLKNIGGAITGPGMVRALDAAGFTAEGIAKQIANAKKILDTGFLISTIQSREPFLVRGGGFVDVSVAAIYAKFHEFGTSKMAARPFLRPTLIEGKARIQRAFSGTLKSEINNAIK